jgi:hypothetical protein
MFFKISCLYLTLSLLVEFTVQIGNSMEGEESVPRWSGHLEIEKHTPIPHPQVVRSWLSDSLDKEEIWMFNSYSELDKLLYHEDLDQQLTREIKLNYHEDAVRALDPRVRVLAALGYGPGYVLLPRRLSGRVTSRLRASVYAAMEERFFTEWLKFPSYSALRVFLRNGGASLVNAIAIARKAINYSRQIILPLTPDLKEYINPELREQIELQLARQAEAKNNNLDLNVTLVMEPSDEIPLVVNRFRGNRFGKVLVRYLQQLRDAQPRGALRIPLQSILYPFVNENVHKYTCTGPNCHYASANASRSKNRLSVPPSPGEMIRFSEEHYRKIARPERVADLFVFRAVDERGYYLSPHSTTFSARDGRGILVFTKNGFYGDEPYLFQFQDHSELHYRQSNPGMTIENRREKCADFYAHLITSSDAD